MIECPESLSDYLQLGRAIRIRTGNQDVGRHPVVSIGYALFGRKKG
jgi:hypothetical protein